MTAVHVHLYATRGSPKLLPAGRCLFQQIGTSLCGEVLQQRFNGTTLWSGGFYGVLIHTEQSAEHPGLPVQVLSGDPKYLSSWTAVAEGITVLEPRFWTARLGV
jgi:hypothetical protein